MSESLTVHADVRQTINSAIISNHNDKHLSQN